MTTYIVNNTMESFVYELSDREIYNDIRSEIGVSITETVLDSDATYSWRQWRRTSAMPAPGYTTFKHFDASMPNPIIWQLKDVSAKDSSGNPYYNYEISLIDNNRGESKSVEIKNTGSLTGCGITYTVRYKYLSAEEVTHEENVYSTLTTRAFDEITIKKYGRRVMNLVWPQGSEEDTVQGLCNSAKTRYKEPYAHAKLTLLGDTAAKRTIIFGAEISDILTVTDDISYLPTTNFYIESFDLDININDLNIPTMVFGLVALRPIETKVFFRFGSGHFGGPEVFG